MSNTVSATSSGVWGASDGKDKLSRATLTALLSTVAVLWFLWKAKKSRNAGPPLPPGPRGLPLVGYLPFLRADLHRQFEELAGIYGPIYKVWLGKKLCVVVNSPSLVKEVVRDQDAIFANRDPPIAVLASSFRGADIVFLPHGPDWKKLRKIFVREMLSNTNLDRSYALRREEVRKSIKNVYEKIGTPIDFGELAFLTVISAIMSMLWGGTQGGVEGVHFGAELKTLLADLMVVFGAPNVSDFFPVLARFDLQGYEKRAKSIFGWIERILDSVIEKRRNLVEAKEEGPGSRMNEQRKDFLQILLELTERDDAATSLCINQVKAVLMDTMVGASETTVTMVEWVMAELMEHPELMEKVLEELTEVVGLDNLVEETHLPKLRYLDAVIKETFRLHVPLPFIVPRRPSQSSTIGGYCIPKDTRVMINVWAIHRDPKIWDSPLEFQPERFLNSKWDYSGNNFHYLPFGSGRRIRAGLPLGERTLIYIIASFLHAYEWKLPQDTEQDLSDIFGIVTKKLNSTIAIPTPRLSRLELYTK
ncbi:labd-13Z-ene-9,15,16-triol synthase, chloroplastic-like [Juglans microcarpa x Juglans regia]|uniref:labd-13Z-ene-9,15,16-triol synthase, chloroplastic-like n=1 Tax=Juglans microcarpa x Juglans regia TaxID=2249226 RepID=UPI001B7EA9F0|nr:labd-13Z-ene-9,15,16-triol synthase, chloroplastic-like [Juglans microcarpa x Juglans regia]